MTSSEICNICEEQIALGAEYWTRGGLNYCRKCNVQYSQKARKQHREVMQPVYDTVRKEQEKANDL